MGRFYDRYLKHPEKGIETYRNQACFYGASIALGWGFGESMDDYLARSPAATMAIKEAREDRDRFDEMLRNAITVLR